MCDITTALVIVGGAISVAGQMQASQAAQQQANFQAAVARNNEIIAGRLAEDARARGKAQSARQANITRQLIGRQRVVQAGLGQLVDTGSALDLTADAAATGKLEERIIQTNAEREAIGFLTQGMNFAAEAQLLRLQGRAARRAGIIGAFGTAITTAGSVSSRWRNRVPTFPSSFGPQFGSDLRESGSF